jgi:hypothetical protein
MGEERALKSLSLEEFPSWFTFPDKERVEWINMLVTALWPHIGDYGEAVLR